MKTTFIAQKLMKFVCKREQGGSLHALVKMSSFIFGIGVYFLLTLSSASAQSPPSSSLFGPVKAYTTDTSLTVTCQVASDADPVLSYTLANNSTGAAVVSTGNIQYNQALGVFTQAVSINPGGNKGSFTIYANTTTPYGTCQSSMSVTVINR